MEQKLLYKKRLHQYCVEIIQQRINAALQAMQNAQAAANSEEKSSAGDKYETGRAMSHLEKDMHARQLAANQNEQAALLAVDSNATHKSVAAGSIVICNEIIFFIAAGIGKITFENETVYLLSPNAPLAKSMFGKVAGDSFNFNNKLVIIREVF
jgi:transcription elongation GreA/GreB family factor